MGRTSTPKSASRHFGFKLLSVAIGGGLALLLVEIVLRAVPGVFGADIKQQLTADPRNYGIPHPYIGHLHRPDTEIVVSGKDFSGVHRVDKAGFRNNWPWPAHPDIVILGDSVTFGYGVNNEETWPAILSRSLGKSAVVNLALIGAGPQQYLRVYETFGANLHPRLVLVGFWARNDFWDAELFDRWLTSGSDDNYLVWRDFGRPERVTLSVRHPVRALEGLFTLAVDTVLRNSRLYNLARVERDGLQRRAGGPPKTFRSADGGRLQLQMSDYALKVAKGQSGDRGFQLTVDALQRLDSLTLRGGAHMLVVLLPSKEETYGPLLGSNVDDPTRALRAALDDRGIDYLDLAPEFLQRASAGDRLFFEVDEHPNQAGYALIARLVRAHIDHNGQKLLPEDH
jgi:hypothetical protein